MLSHLSLSLSFLFSHPLSSTDGYNLSLPSDFQPLLGGPGGARAGAKDHHGEGEEGEHAEGGPEHEECELAVASFDWANVQNPMIIATFLFFSALTKISKYNLPTRMTVGLSTLTMVGGLTEPSLIF